MFLFALHPVSTLYIYIIVFAPKNFAKLILCKIKLYVLLVFTFFKGTLSTFQKNLSLFFLKNIPLQASIHPLFKDVTFKDCSSFSSEKPLSSKTLFSSKASKRFKGDFFLQGQPIFSKKRPFFKDLPYLQNKDTAQF